MKTVKPIPYPIVFLCVVVILALIAASVIKLATSHKDPISSLNPPATREELARFKIFTDDWGWYADYPSGHWEITSKPFESSNAVLKEVAAIIANDRLEAAQIKAIGQRSPAPLDKVFYLVTAAEVQEHLETASNVLLNIVCSFSNALDRQIDGIRQGALTLHDVENDKIKMLESRIEQLEQTKQDKPMPTNSSLSIWLTNYCSPITNIFSTNDIHKEFKEWIEQHYGHATNSVILLRGKSKF